MKYTNTNKKTKNPYPYNKKATAMYSPCFDTETEALTQNELNLLLRIKKEQNEEGHSNFTSENDLSKSEGGTLSSLEKKGYIYNSYNMTAKELRDLELPANFKMWCFTHKAVFMVGRPNGWSYYDSGYKMEIEFECE